GGASPHFRVWIGAREVARQRGLCPRRAIEGSTPLAGALSCPLMSSHSGGFTAAHLSWSKVDVLTAYERLTAEIQVRGGRLRETINDPEPLFHLRNVSSEPVLPGAVPLSGVPEGLFNKNFIGGIRTIEPEPPPADQIVDLMRRYVMFQAANFMVTGAAEFPKATEQAMHT